MTPKQVPIRAKDLVARDKSPRVKAIFDRALERASRDQRELLEKAAKLDK